MGCGWWMWLTSRGEGEITLADCESWLRTTLALSLIIYMALIVPGIGETPFFSLFSNF